MRNVVISGRFKKDIKLLSKTQKFKKYALKLENYINMLCAGITLPEEAKNHPLAKHSPKEYFGCYDFHLAPDICVIYRLTANSVELIRIGQHNNLGLTENL